MDDLNDLRKIAEEATPGPWVYGDNRDGLGNKLHPAKFPGKYNPIADFEYTEDEDAEHIATFDPPAILALLTRLEQVEQAVARVRESHTEYVISEWDLDTNSFKLDEEGRTVPMASLCLECSGDEPIADAEDGNWTEDSDNSVYYPCPTLRALDGER